MNTTVSLGARGLFLRVYLPFAGGYFMSYLYRTVNAVVGPVIARELDLSAADLGLLSAAYFISFAAVQLPLGVMLDRFGPRRVQTALLLIAAAGGALFGLGNTMPELFMGRMLIGLGVSAGLMGSLKIITLWFPQSQWPLMNGLLMAAGGLGSLTATAPSQAALGIMTWHSLFFWLSGITICISALIWLAVPEKPAPVKTDSWAVQFQAIGEIARDAFFWRILPVFTLQQASFIGVQTLWVGPWLRDVAGQDAMTRANDMFFIALSLTLGFLTSGMVSGLLRRAGLSNMTIGAGVIALFLLLSAGIAAVSLGSASWIPHMMLWCPYAFIGSYAIIYFPVLTAAFPTELSGRVTTSANFLLFLSIFLIQWGIGRMLDFWPRTAAGGYAPEGYGISFVVLTGLQAIAWLWLFVFRPRPMAEHATAPARP